MNDGGTTVNDMTQPDKTALTVIPATALPTILAADKDDILGGLAEELRGFKADASTEKGRKEIGSKKRKVGIARQDLIRLAKTLTEDHQAIINGVRSEVKIVDQKMDELIASLDAPLEAYRARLKAHEDAIAQIEAWAIVPADWTADQIAAHIDATSHHEHLARNWQEFAARAKAAIAGAVDTMHRAHAAAIKREAEAAELARLREAEVRRERERQEQERIDREARIAAEAAEKATRDAEAKAAEEAAAAERRAQAERDAAAKRERDAAERLLRAEREKIEADERAKEAEAKAERDRVAAEQKAERDRAAAVEAERHRIEAAADAQRQADEARAANMAHRATINRAAPAAIQAVITAHGAGTIIAEEAARAIVTAIAKGEVPHVSVNY